MLQSSSVAMVKTASVYLNRCILEIFFKWKVIVKMTMLTSQPELRETVGRGEQRLIPLDAALSGVK